MRIQIQFLLCLALTILHAPLCSCPLQKLVLPLAKQLLAEVWSPYSRRQSVAAAAMLTDLLVYVPAEDEALQVGLGLCHACLGCWHGFVCMSLQLAGGLIVAWLGD